MSKYIRTALLVAVGVLCVASAAFASVPDPTQITCPTFITYEPAGNLAVPFTVNVKNQFGVNISGSNVLIDFGAAPVVFCANQTGAGYTRSGQTVSATTNVSGNAVFNIRASKCGNGSVAKIYADGVLICSISKLTSPDFDGNGSVSLPDLGTFALDQSTGNLCADFDGGGSVNLPDLGIFAASQAHGPCP